MLANTPKPLEGREHPIEVGFYRSESRDYVYVNEHGTVLDDRTGKILDQFTTPYGYKSVILEAPRELKFLHVLLAETFLVKPETDKKLVVNHKDGDKKHNYVSNLEWSTYTDNIIHAYKTGLRDDNRPVLVKNLRTGDVKRYYSQAEAAKALGVNPTNICIYLKRPRFEPFRYFYDIIREGEEWNKIPDKYHGENNTGAKTLIGRQKSKNIVVIFGTVARAEKYTGLSRRIIMTRLMRQKIPPKSHGFKPIEIDWEFFYHEDREIDLSTAVRVDVETKRGYNKGSGRKAPKVRVYDEAEGSEAIYSSLAEFAQIVGMKKDTLQKYIWERGRWQNYRIEYLQ